MVTHMQAEAFAGTWGGYDILKNVFGFLYFLCKTDCSTQNFTFLKLFISKTDFTAIKYSGQGSIKAKKETIDKLLFLLKTIGIYP